MAIIDDIKSGIEKQAEALGEFTKANTERFTALDERLQELEARWSRPGCVVPMKAVDQEHIKLFENWLRKPRDHQANEQLSNFQRECKAVTIATPADGGYAVPEEIGREIERKQLKLSPVRRIVS